MPHIERSPPFSEMRGHTATRTAGNQSLLAYRSDKACPGYSGYIPGWCTVPIPVTGSTQHTGRLPADSGAAALPETAALPDQRTSEYAARFKPSPPAACARQQHQQQQQQQQQQQDGFWFANRQAQAASAGCPLGGATTYQAELLHGARTAAAQLQQTHQLPATLVGYQTARLHRASGGHTGGACTVATTSSGDMVGYRTTYASTNKPLQQRHRDTPAPLAQQQRPATCGGGERLAAVSGAAPRFTGTSSYARDFGGLCGGGPHTRAATAPAPAQPAALATTGELCAGTTRAALHPPCYRGFIPAACVNATAVAHGRGASSRPDAKAEMLPATLDQYARSRLAGYTGYKPRHTAAGAGAVQPAHGPTAATTQGFADAQVARCAASLATLASGGGGPTGPSHAINSRAGLMSFFSAGGDSVSDNGLSDAQRFFQRRRPLGGRMKH